MAAQTPAAPTPAAEPANATATQNTEPDRDPTSNADQADNAPLTVKRGDTASELLISRASSTVSLDQLLMAMLQQNPKAFVQQNVNRLLADAVVKLPTPEQAAAIDRREARESIRIQVADFQAYRAALAAGAPNAKQADNDPRSSSGKLKADVAKPDAPAADELKLSKPNDQETAQLSQQLQAKENAEQAKAVSDNLSQLGQLSQAASQFTQGLSARFPALAASYDQGKAWLQQHVYETIAGLAVLVALWVAVSMVRRPRAQPEAGEIAAAWLQDFGKALELTDHTGKPRTLGDFKGKVIVLFFGFTQCPDVCPTTLADMAKVVKELGADGAKIQVLFVSVDPERDTQALLSQYVTAFHPSFIGLRGDAQATNKVVKEFKIYVDKKPTKNSDYTVDHSAGIFVLDREGRLRLFAQHIQLGHKRTQVGTGLAADAADRVMQRTAMGTSGVLQLLDAACTNATRGEIDHAQKTGVVAGVFKQAQVGQSVLDFGTFKKPHAAIHPIGQTCIKERSFNDTALGVAAIKHRHLIEPVHPG